MPLRPELPAGLNLSRRVATPVKLPKMTFPTADGYADQPGEAYGPPAPGTHMAAASVPEASLARLALFQQQSQIPEQPAPAPAAPSVPTAQAYQVIIYGRSGCQACMAAIQDLIDRELCFTYFDVGRDAGAMAQLKAICGNEPMVPVIIQVGYSGMA